MQSLDYQILSEIHRKLESIEAKLEAPQSPTEAPMMSEGEAAKLLGLRKQTLALWRAQQRGPRFVKVGRTVRYRRGDLEQFINSEGVTS